MEKAKPPARTVTDEMVRRGCMVARATGGLHFNPHHGADQFDYEIREILEVALGLRELDC